MQWSGQKSSPNLPTKNPDDLTTKPQSPLQTLTKTTTEKTI